jgi:hypothetical protein
MIWMGATIAAIHIAIENMVRIPWLYGLSVDRRSHSRCQAPTAPTTRDVVR